MMTDFPALQAIADRVQIEPLPGEFTDAVMMRDWDRLASLFTRDGALRMHVELVGLEEIRTGIEQAQDRPDYFVQTTHPGTIQLAGDSASGRAYLSELIRSRDGSSHLNYAIYHDRYRRTAEGWKFTERVYEVRYLDTTPLADPYPAARRPPPRPVPGQRQPPAHHLHLDASGVGRPDHLHGHWRPDHACMTKPVTVDFELAGGANDPWGNFRVGFEGKATINRTDWGVSWNAALEGATVMISDKVTLEFDVTATRLS